MKKKKINMIMKIMAISFLLSMSLLVPKMEDKKTLIKESVIEQEPNIKKLSNCQKVKKERTIQTTFNINYNIVSGIVTDNVGGNAYILSTRNEWQFDTSYEEESGKHMINTFSFRQFYYISEELNFGSISYPNGKNILYDYDRTRTYIWQTGLFEEDRYIEDMRTIYHDYGGTHISSITTQRKEILQNQIINFNFVSGSESIDYIASGDYTSYNSRFLPDYLIPIANPWEVQATRTYYTIDLRDIGEAYANGYNDGLEIGFENGVQQAEEQTFSLDWLNVIFNSVNQFLNIEIINGFKLWYLFGVPLIISFVFMILKMFR